MSLVSQLFLTMRKAALKNLGEEDYLVPPMASALKLKVLANFSLVLLFVLFNKFLVFFDRVEPFSFSALSRVG